MKQDLSVVIDTEEIEAGIARRLFQSDTYLDNDVSTQFTEDVIEQYKTFYTLTLL